MNLNELESANYSIGVSWWYCVGWSCPFISQALFYRPEGIVNIEHPDFKALIQSMISIALANRKVSKLITVIATKIFLLLIWY